MYKAACDRTHCFVLRVSPNIFVNWLVVHMHFNTFCVLCIVKADD